jgi:hypothetical protein
MRLSRRHLLSAAAALPFMPQAARAAGPVTVNLDPKTVLGTIAADYMGLGYEISSVAVPGLLSAKNQPYVRLVKNLGREGVIRIGGNTSDFSSYDAKGEAKSLPKGTVVTEANLRELRTFLDATGWRLIWGLNLGSDKLDNAVEQARAVAGIMGNKLIALEIGNEPDLFPNQGHRPRPYDFGMWLTDYRRYKAAIRAVLPQVAFAGPDLAGAVDWMEQFARQESDIALLTAHHYITGQANPAATLETILAPNLRYRASLARFQAAAKAAGKPWRMCETASFSGGGKAGVSNTFASALWALDYLLELASFGCSGVNMETGVNHLGRISYYTPINDDLQGNYSAAPEYWGLQAFAQMPKGDLLAVDCQTGGINLTAHAVRNGREICVAVINKDLRQAASVEIMTGAIPKTARVMRLHVPGKSEASLAATATTGISLERPNGYTSLRVDNAVHVDVPAASAMLVWVN